MVRDEEEIRFVVDTNRLISALMKSDSLTVKILRTNACIFLLSLGWPEGDATGNTLCPSEPNTCKHTASNTRWSLFSNL
jgi:hypothetical protein